MFTDTVQWTIARQRHPKESGSQGQIALQLTISRKDIAEDVEIRRGLRST